MRASALIQRIGAFIGEAFKGAAVLPVLQALDNAAYGSLRLARRVKIHPPWIFIK